MVERISEEKLKFLSGKHNFNIIYLEKDYFITLLLYFLKDISNLYFKGGTALNKIFLNHARISEDLDFTYKGDLKYFEDHLLDIINKNKSFFTKIEKEGLTEKSKRFKIYYSGYYKKDYIIIDLNLIGSVLKEPEKHVITHFYEPHIPTFKISTLNFNELKAEKIRALCMRYKPRDYYDTYLLITKGENFDMNLIKKKLKDVGRTFTVKDIFKHTNRIHKEWKEDLSQIVNKEIDFKVVMKTLTRYFKYR